MSPTPVYLDNHATTRTDPRVVAAMLPYFDLHYGNAASVQHRYGWEAAEAVDRAREEVAALIGADPKEVVFTSGATEANNLAIKGIATAAKRRGNHLVTAAAEHKAVLDPVKRLAREGAEITVVPVDSTGMVSPEAIAAAITERTVLVSVMAANNEVGTLNPISEIGAICQERGIPFHTDATQAIGKVPIDVRTAHVDLLSLSAHKFYGPKGIGALFVRRGEPGLRLAPLFDGGGHERGLRSGTLPVPLIVGLGQAALLAQAELPEEARRLTFLRNQLHQGLRARIPDLRLNGHEQHRLPGNLHVSIPDVEGEALMLHLREIAVSSGSACTSAQSEPSHVLQAIGLDEALARASLRFGLGRFTTPEEVAFAAAYVSEIVDRLRNLRR